MSVTSSHAMHAAAPASSMERTDTMSTRRSMSGGWVPMCSVSSVGPREGDTGRPPRVAACSTACVGSLILDGAQYLTVGGSGRGQTPVYPWRLKNQADREVPVSTLVSLGARDSLNLPSPHPSPGGRGGRGRTGGRPCGRDQY